jgi:hypothetical protein
MNMAIATIDELPASPDPATDTPALFSQKAAAMVLAQKGMIPQMNTFGAQANELANDVTAKSAAAVAAAQTATSAAADATFLVGVNAWISGTTYAKNVAVISQVNFQTYRRRVAGAGTVDPANDSTNWAMLTGSGSFIPQAAATTSIDLSRGNYFTKTLNGNETLTFDNCPQDGYSFTLEIDVTTGVLTLPTTVRTPNSTVYSLTAGKSHLLFFVTKNRGARWRMTAAPNYDI